MSELLSIGIQKDASRDVEAILSRTGGQVIGAESFDFDISEAALDQIKHARTAGEEQEEAFLRIGVRGGGCAGLQYTLDFTEEIHADDWVTSVDGELVAMDFYSAMYLSGAHLDFVDGMHGSGFKFMNPNAKRSCGCGSSFSAE